jgi:hypothetical protein
MAFQNALNNNLAGPVHEHDCDLCEFIGTYKLRHEQYDDHHMVSITHGDLYLSCDGSFYKYIVRYGEYGQYATTNNPSGYILAPIIDGIDKY